MIDTNDKLVTLMGYTDLSICSHAIRTCWQSFSRSDGGNKDRELIDRVGNKLKHSSTLEHINYTFYIQNVSRAVLQEIARHRHASPSVKSTRYTLKELKRIEDIPLEIDTDEGPVLNYPMISKFCVITGDAMVDYAIGCSLVALQRLVKIGVKNDIVKYALPEAYKTELTFTINARSLQNFLSLRTDPAALWEIRRLGKAIYDVLPNDHIFIFKDLMRM